MTKFLNISTDTTLGGNSASDDTVSSQKAVKAYVDSQTGTAPAFANITGQPTDNANLATALAGKVPTSRTINSKALTSDITLTASDVGADASGSASTAETNAKNYADGLASNYATAAQGLKADTALQPNDNITQLTNNAGYITGITSSDVTTALGYTPYNSSNPAGYTSNVGTVTSVNNVSPVNGNVTLSIPTVNDATLTITQGGTTKGTFTANASSNVMIDLDSGGGSSRNIGEIVSSTIPLTDVGLHLLDGALIQGSGSYADFVDYIAGLVSTYPDLFTTESAWQTAVTTYGVCGKFVYDSVNNTVRLPKYNFKIYTGGGTASVVGNGTALGLTNGNKEGYLSSWRPGSSVSGTLALSNSSTLGNNSGNYATGSTSAFGISLDPEKSGLVAQLSDITTSLDGYYYIVIATSTKTDIEVDIDEIATDLNGKADIDLSNCTKPHIVETYVNGTSWYRVYSDGWCEQGGMQTTNLTNNNATVLLLKTMSNTNYSIQISPLKASSSNSYNLCSYGDVTTSSFKIYAQGSIGSTQSWQVCGYIS